MIAIWFEEFTSSISERDAGYLEGVSMEEGVSVY